MAVEGVCPPAAVRPARRGLQLFARGTFTAQSCCPLVLCAAWSAGRTSQHSAHFLVVALLRRLRLPSHLPRRQSFGAICDTALLAAPVFGTLPIISVLCPHLGWVLRLRLHIPGGNCSYLALEPAWWRFALSSYWYIGCVLWDASLLNDNGFRLHRSDWRR